MTVIFCHYSQEFSATQFSYTYLYRHYACYYFESFGAVSYSPSIVTSYLGQLSLVIPLWVGAMNTSLGWEGNASQWPCVTDNSSLPTYGLNGLCQGDEHPAHAGA